MNISYLKFKEVLGPYLCFSVHEAKKHFPGFDRKRLSEWQKKGYIQKVIRGYYIFNDAPKNSQLFWWYASNYIFEPSYISLQSALGHYGFIPEFVFQITAITTKRTRNLMGPDISFIYRNIKKEYYFGFTLLPFTEEHTIRLAEPEKAILDLLYLEPSMDNLDDFGSWRLNREIILDTIDQNKMDQYSLIIKNRQFQKRYSIFKEWLHA